jgi:hypothetical protein
VQHGPMGCLLAYKDPISFLIIRANGPTCRVNGPRANGHDTAKDLFYPFLAMPTAPHSKQQQTHTNIECSVYPMFKVCCLSWYYMN